MSYIITSQNVFGIFFFILAILFDQVFEFRIKAADKKYV